MAQTILKSAAFAGGLMLVGWTIISAIRSFVLPRSDNVFLTRVVFKISGKLFALRMAGASTYAGRDRIMAMFAPFSLLFLPVAWLTLITLGYMIMFWALGARPWYNAFLLSGSSLLTLGFAPTANLSQTILAFSEATIGLGMVALLVAYLPTMYTAFSRREAAVTLLEVRAGSPPSAVEMLKRFHRIQGLGRLTEQWVSWEVWFAEVEESHTSLAPLVYFRSPHPARSWITAAGAVLDAAALTASTLDVPRTPQAALCIRAGYIALRSIADFFRVPYNPNPRPNDPISISRAEFDVACRELAAQGVPLKDDHDQAWRDFAGWRVNYDTVLLALAELTMAPEAPWSSDRLHRGKTGPVN